MRRKSWIVITVGALTLLVALPFSLQRPATGAASAAITVYQNPRCGCCEKWAEHLRRYGYKVTTQYENDMAAVRAKLAVPRQMAACHTAVVDGYVVEGHVPADAIEKLLADKPNVKGIAVPGMPVGSPGMEGEGVAQRYNVFLFDENGTQVVYQRR